MPIHATACASSGGGNGDAGNASRDLDWLRRMGVVEIDEHGAWSLTDLGKGAMARFYQGFTMPAEGEQALERASGPH